MKLADKFSGSHKLMTVGLLTRILIHGSIVLSAPQLVPPDPVKLMDDFTSKAELNSASLRIPFSSLLLCSSAFKKQIEVVSDSKESWKISNAFKISEQCSLIA